MADWLYHFFQDVKVTDIVTAVFTVVLSWVGYQQLKTYRKQAELMDSQLRVAQDTAEISKTTLENTVRAFVAVKNIEGAFAVDNDRIIEWQLFPIIANEGNTSTRKAEIRVNWIVQRDPVRKDFDFPDIIRSTERIGPIHQANLNSKQIITGPRAIIPIQSVQKVFDERWHLYIWGWVNYNDVLKNTPRRRTEFAVEALLRKNPSLFPTKEQNFSEYFSTLFDFRSMYNHDGTDSECFRCPDALRPSYESHFGPRQDQPGTHPMNEGASPA